MSKWIRFEFNNLDPFTCKYGGIFKIDDETYKIKRVYRRLNRVYAIQINNQAEYTS